MNNRKLIPVIGFIVLVAVTFLGLGLTRNIGKSKKEIDADTALKRLADMNKRVAPVDLPLTKASVEFTDSSDDGSELPEITDSSISVRATTELYAEIDSSPEKAGTGSDAWLTDLAMQFNGEGFEINGKPVSIQLRNLSSGLVGDYIRTGKHVPDGYSPSNMMWIDMLKSYGVKLDVIDESMVGNTAVIVLENSKYKEFTEKYGSVDLKSVVEATEKGDFVMGYTNPFVSSTGLNFLVSTLQRYDNDNPLSDAAMEGFAKFQNNVPFVAFNTIQMREASENGSLDGFVLEMQTYNNDAMLKRNYTAVPFGYRHDNPLVAVANILPEKKEILKKFAEYCESSAAQSAADKYGFNSNPDYKYEQPDLDGQTLIQAQKAYKEKKDNGKTVVGVFVCDVSGSMDGAPMNGIKESLINSMQYISPDNYIGLVTYNSDVYINVPIEKFDLMQQSYFKGGVQSMSAVGGTATYDGVITALSMIEEKIKDIPDAKPMVFVLSDGDTNSGYSFNEVQEVIGGLKVPIYTINYNYAGSEALKTLSGINEAASIDANTDDVVYQLKNLLNASM